MDYWQRVLEEVKNRHNPHFKKYFVHFPEHNAPSPSLNKGAAARSYDRKNPKRYLLGDHFPGVYLTQREFDCVSLFLRGMSYSAIARQLKLSVRTVECHVSSIRAKTGDCSRDQLYQTLLLKTDMHQYLEPVFFYQGEVSVK